MKISSEKILFFDLDGTLVDTDYANWLSYKEAANILGYNLRELADTKMYYQNTEGDIYNPLYRFDKNSLNNELPVDIRSKLLEQKCIREKEKLMYTKKIEENVSILKRYSKTNKIVLVSNCKRERGEEVIKHHKLEFYRTFFHEDKTLSENKYENAIEQLGISPKDIIAFEDSEEEIQKAKDSGIQYINVYVDGENIKEIFGGVFKNSTAQTLIFQSDKAKIRVKISNEVLKRILENQQECELYIDNNFEGITLNKQYNILVDGLKPFIIKTNPFLKQDIQSFYHKEYFGGNNNWNMEGRIEHLIWTIKNDEGCKESHRLYLSTACKRLKNILYQDLLKIRNEIGIDLTVCVVPRAKEGFLYRKDQMLFRQIVSNVVNNLTSFEDGTKYIVRHTTTKTTHLRNSGEENSKSPYIGITKDTCYISDNIIGKNILLIDDIYTKSINIDEDAIQALLDKGAKDVWFYSIGKTHFYE